MASVFGETLTKMCPVSGGGSVIIRGPLRLSKSLHYDCGRLLAWCNFSDLHDGAIRQAENLANKLLYLLAITVTTNSNNIRVTEG